MASNSQEIRTENHNWVSDRGISKKYHGLIRDKSHANELCVRRNELHLNKCQDHIIRSRMFAIDYPHNDVERQKSLVGQIFEAIRNELGILDVRSSAGAPNLDADRVRLLFDVDVEILAWNILVLTDE